MSARDEAVEMIRRICPPHLDADEYGRILAEKFDAHTAEVRREDAARLLDERRDHASREGFCNGIVHCANRLTEWANGGPAPAPDDGEAAVLRGLLRAVECAARRGDVKTLLRMLSDHARDRKGGGR